MTMSQYGLTSKNRYSTPPETEGDSASSPQSRYFFAGRSRSPGELSRTDISTWSSPTAPSSHSRSPSPVSPGKTKRFFNFFGTGTRDIGLHKSSDVRKDFSQAAIQYAKVMSNRTFGNYCKQGFFRDLGRWLPVCKSYCCGCTLMQGVTLNSFLMLLWGVILFIIWLDWQLERVCNPDASTMTEAVAEAEAAAEDVGVQKVEVQYDAFGSPINLDVSGRVILPIFRVSLQNLVVWDLPYTWSVVMNCTEFACLLFAGLFGGLSKRGTHHQLIVHVILMFIAFALGWTKIGMYIINQNRADEYKDLPPEEWPGSSWQFDFSTGSWTQSSIIYLSNWCFYYTFVMLYGLVNAMSLLSRWNSEQRSYETDHGDSTVVTGGPIASPIRREVFRAANGMVTLCLIAGFFVLILFVIPASHCDGDDGGDERSYFTNLFSSSDAADQDGNMTSLLL